MTRIIEDRKFVCRTLFLALLTSTLAVPIYSQSNSPNTDRDPPKTNEDRGAQEPKDSTATDSKIQASAPSTPEQLRQAEIEADTKKLYQLAAELRAEVAKTYKTTLSLNVIKKAEALEKLAKSLKARMGGEAAASKHQNE